MKQIKKILILLPLLLGLQAHAQTCKDNITLTTPDSRFTDNGNGTVTDKQTNLVWMRCALGQTWEGATCTGSATTYTWQQTLQTAEGYTFAGSNAWRVPNIKELASIVEDACYDPAINQTIFPATPSNQFWTSSPNAYVNGVAWGVYFDNGDDYDGSKSLNCYVRLVHSDSNVGGKPGIGDPIDFDFDDEGPDF